MTDSADDRGLGPGRRRGRPRDEYFKNNLDKDVEVLLRPDPGTVLWTESFKNFESVSDTPF